MKGLSLQPLHNVEKRIAKEEEEEGRLKKSNDHLKAKISAVKRRCRSLMVYAPRASKALRLCISATDHL
jgi:hypothetical protein